MQALEASLLVHLHRPPVLIHRFVMSTLRSDSMIYVSYRGDLDRKEIERLIIGAGFDGIEFIENGSE